MRHTYIRTPDAHLALHAVPRECLYCLFYYLFTHSALCNRLSAGIRKHARAVSGYYYRYGTRVQYPGTF